MIDYILLVQTQDTGELDELTKPTVGVTRVATK